MTAQRTFLLKLVAIAFLVRVAFLLVYGGINYYDGISKSNLEIIRNIIDGRGAVVHVDVAPAHASAPQWSYEPYIERPIGYALLLVPVFAITRSVIALQIFQALLASVSAVLLWRIGQFLATERTARLGAIVYALWPLSIRFDIVVLPDALVAPFLLASLWLLLRGLRDEGNRWWFILSGIACGVAMTMRADVVLLPGALVLALVFVGSLRKVIRQAVLIALGVGVVVLLHLWRNYEVTRGEVIPLAIGSGISLWEGISQFGDTLGTIYGDARTVEQEGWRSWAYPDGIARDRKRMREATAIIREHPGFYAQMMVKRIPILLKPDGILMGHFMPTPGEYFAGDRQRSWRTYVSDYPVTILGQILIIVGQLAALLLVIRGFQPRRQPLLWLPLAIILYYLFIHMMTNAEARYMYPALPFILMMAAVGVERLLMKRKEQAS